MARDFTVRFNVEDSVNADTYRTFIGKLRQLLGDDMSSTEIPILCPEPPEGTPPNGYFDVVLQTGQHTVRFRFRRDNLYLFAYQMPNTDQWMETRNDRGVHLITGSPRIPAPQFLPYTGEYTDLIRENRDLQNTRVGYWPLIAAVNALATATDEQDGRRAKSLVTVAVMISEAVRFVEVLRFIVQHYHDDDNTIGGHLVDVMRSWQDVSERMLRAEHDPNYTFEMPEPNHTGIRTLEQAIAALGILKYYCIQRRYRRDVSFDDSVQHAFGQMLAEVFSIRIDKIDGEDPGELYGTISVTDGLSYQCLYSTESNEYESIKPGNMCTLTGPYRCISAYGSFTINLNLKDYDTISADDEVSCGQVTWNVYDFTNSFNVLLSQKVDGKYGSSTVNYAVFSNAVQAILEVTLINGDGENPAQVYGLLAAQDNLLGQEIRLFRISEPKKYINVSPGRRIPLARSAVVVSLKSSLTVRAELYDYNTVFPDHVIAKGGAKFLPRLSGTSTLNITGNRGVIEVKVTWINN